MSTQQVGTHGGHSRPRDGWTNTCAEVVNPRGGGRKIRKARAKLAARIKSFEDRTKCKATNGYNKPGSLKTN